MTGDDHADDTLTGSTENDRLLGLGGSDQFSGDGGLFSGGDGEDVFLVGLEDSDDGGFGTAERIDLSGTGIENFADLLGGDSDDGALATFADGHALTFLGIEATELSAVNVLFADEGDASNGDDAGAALIDGGAADDAAPLSGDGDADVFIAASGNDLVDRSGILDVTAFNTLDISEFDAGGAGGGTPTFQEIAAADLAAESFIFTEDGGVLIAGMDGDSRLLGSEAHDAFLFDPNSADDAFTGLHQDDLLDISAAGLAGFDALDIPDFDDGAVLTSDDGSSLSFEGVDAVDLDAFTFLLDT